MARAEIWTYKDGYERARSCVEGQSITEDILLITSLFGYKLPVCATAADVKVEALRQLEINYRSERNEDAEFHANLALAMADKL